MLASLYYALATVTAGMMVLVLYDEFKLHEEYYMRFKWFRALLKLLNFGKYAWAFISGVLVFHIFITAILPPEYFLKNPNFLHTFLTWLFNH